jgi:hypothetical protein
MSHLRGAGNCMGDGGAQGRQIESDMDAGRARERNAAAQRHDSYDPGMQAKTMEAMRSLSHTAIWSSGRVPSVVDDVLVAAGQ